jgi:hypothetical protein
MMKNAFLALMLISLVSATDRSCPGAAHDADADGRAAPEWEIKVYQNFDRHEDLESQGIDSERINRLVWDECEREQDCIGPRIHKRLYFCTQCLYPFLAQFAGEDNAMQAMLAAQRQGQSILLLGVRGTYQAGIAIVPYDIAEKDVLSYLSKESIRYN